MLTQIDPRLVFNQRSTQANQSSLLFLNDFLLIIVWEWCDCCLTIRERTPLSRLSNMAESRTHHSSASRFHLANLLIYQSLTESSKQTLNAPARNVLHEREEVYEMSARKSSPRQASHKLVNASNMGVMLRSDRRSVVDDAQRSRGRGAAHMSIPQARLGDHAKSEGDRLDSLLVVVSGHSALVKPLIASLAHAAPTKQGQITVNGY